MLKKCFNCQLEKELDCFSKNKTKKDGLQSKCKSCEKLRYFENRSTILKQRKIYRTSNKESAAEYQKVYRRVNKNKATKYSKAYYKNNKGKLANYNKSYYVDNKARILKQVRAYIVNHPERYHNKDARFFCTFVCKPIILKRDNYVCQLCGSSKELKIHHILPVKYDTDDSNILNPSNLITLCHVCHLYKAHIGDYHQVDTSLATTLFSLVEEKELVNPTKLPEYKENKV